MLPIDDEYIQKDFSRSGQNMVNTEQLKFDRVDENGQAAK